MSTKCVKCGVVSEVDRAFRNAPAPLNNEVIEYYCPDCWSKHELGKIKGSLALYVVGLTVACIWVVGEPSEPSGWVLLNFLLLPLFLVTSILPHELGHAVAARLLGGQVLAVSVGHGKKLFELKLPGQTVTFHLIPLGGYTVSTHRDKSWFRTKLFLVTSAGPLANIVMVVMAWPLLPLDNMMNWHLDRGLVPVQTFLVANLITALVNLWPSTFYNERGKRFSDGRSLIRVFWLEQKTIDRCNVLYYIGKASARIRKKKYQDAQSCLQNGLERFPGNLTLLLHSSANLINLQQFGTARDIMLKLLARADITAEARYALSNNLAYADILMGDAALLEEADRFSTDAVNNLPWKAYTKGTRGSVLVELGRIEDGIQLLQFAVRNAETKKSKALNCCWLAIAEAKRRNITESKKYLETARRLDPDCFLIERGLQATAGSVPAAPEKTNQA